jgi:sensor histidine kinase YesM
MPRPSGFLRKPWLPLIGVFVFSCIISSRIGGLPGAAIGDFSFSAVLLAVACLVAVATTKEYLTTPRWLFFTAGVGAACGVIAWRASTSIIIQWARRADSDYLELISPSMPLRMGLFMAVGVAVAVIAVLQRRLREAEEKLDRAQDSAELHRDAELFKLRQQFGPHFLYNSLNSVSALVTIEPDKAQEMIGRLAHFMRASVRREMAESVPLADELSYLNEYLAIEGVRFGDRLVVHVEDDGACDDCTVPPFLLQPLLENAIKYGVYGTTGPVEISVRISRITGALRIVIANPFDPLTAPPSGTGFGLEGVSRRLTLLFGRTDLITTARAENTFTTTLTIPQNSRG